MITVVAIDALEYELVQAFGTENLKLSHFGKTDITEFSKPRTMVLWSSFMTGKNKEEEILAMGDKGMWNTRIPHEETFFSRFEKPCVIDLPGYNYDLEAHEAERNLLKAFFDASSDDEKVDVRKRYNEHAFAHHRKIKEEFRKALSGDYDFLLGYFSVIDVIGHLNFGNRTMMKMLYKELDELAGQVTGKRLVLSDHGMEAVGQFGDHSNYGFWATNFRELGTPKITDFGDIIMSEAGNGGN